MGRSNKTSKNTELELDSNENKTKASGSNIRKKNAEHEQSIIKLKKTRNDTGDQ